MTKIIYGDSLEIMRGVEPGSIDAIITDPPYSSGGMFRGDRMSPTGEKYFQNTQNVSFGGDNMDQRSWGNWVAEWLSVGRTITKEGGVAAIFIDWRQLPSLSDAIQWSGWIWRGIMVWNKKNARVQLVRPFQEAEFILWASKGAMSRKRDSKCLRGVFSISSVHSSKRKHQTEKPLELMRELVQICERGGTILDPFMGSGSTVEAAILEGYNVIGIERDRHYYDVAEQRIKNVKELKERDDYE